MAKGKWTYESCKRAAFKCSTLKEFVHLYIGAYRYALRNGFLADFKWLKRAKNANKRWDDYGKCFLEARKYNSRTAFQKGCRSAYIVALRNGWLNDYSWFVAKEELCRAGRTKWTYSACRELASKCKTKIELKRMSQSAYEAAKKNGWVNDYYWFVKGGVKWNYEACFKLATSCRTVSELAKKSDAAYNQAKANGWIKDYAWFVSTTEARKQGLARAGVIKWDHEKVRDAALSCKTLREFATKYVGAYYKALRTGWIDDFDWLIRGNTPFETNRDNVYAYFFHRLKAVYVGRTVDCDRRDKEHREGGANDPVLRFALSNKVVIPPMTILDRGLSLVEGKEREHQYVVTYKTNGWHVLNRGKTGIRSGSLGSLDRGKWNYKTCFDEASKYKTLMQFIKGSPSAYNVARKSKWLKLYGWLLKEKRKWTFEAVYIEAKKYATASEFKNGNMGAYDKARRRGWLKEFSWFIRVQEWSYERCCEEAKKYKSRVEFKNNCLGGYTKAVRAGWIKDYVWLVPNRRAEKAVVQLLREGAIVCTYRSIHDAARHCHLRASGIAGCLSGRYKQSGGYIWRYADNIAGGPRNGIRDEDRHGVCNS